MKKKNKFKEDSETVPGVFDIFNHKKEFEGEVPPAAGPEMSWEELMSDYGNAKRVQFYFSELMIHHHAEKTWLRWEGSHWARDLSNSIVKSVVVAIRNIVTIEIPWLKFKHKQAKLEGKPYDLILPVPEWLVVSHGRSKIKAAADLATALMPLTEDLDSHKYLLNVLNGTIDLKTGVLHPHNREDYITKIASVAFVPNAPCPKFLAFLDRAFPDNATGIRFIQKILGYSLTGDVSEKRFFIFWGATGNNGKTMIFNVIRAILGVCYRIQLASESLVSGRVSSIRSDLAKLKGFRFVTASETDKKYQFNEALIKLLTGGDTLTARHPHEKEIEFNPELKLLLATNPKPEFTLSDDAMMNRVCIIPFYISIPPEEQNKNLTQELIDEEAPGILAWMVQGAVLWANETLGENPFDQKEAAVIKHVVKLEQFIEVCCSRANKNNHTMTSELLEAFKAYKTEMDDPSPDPSDKEFGSALNDAGIEAKKISKGTLRLSIELNAKGIDLVNASREKGSETATAVGDMTEMADMVNETRNNSAE